MPAKLEIEVRTVEGGRFGIFYRNDPSQLWTVYVSRGNRAEADALAGQIRSSQMLKRVVDAPNAGQGPVSPNLGARGDINYRLKK